MSESEAEEIDRRRKALETELEGECKVTHCMARKLEGRISFFFWLQMIAGGTASLLGLTRFDWVAAWMVSLVAAVATACTVVVRESKWRDRANWFYTRRDKAHALLCRLRYEMPIQITKDNLAAISEDYRREREALGLRMAAINAGSPEEKPGDQVIKR
jgi:hypothetical protein